MKNRKRFQTAKFLGEMWAVVDVVKNATVGVHPSRRAAKLAADNFNQVEHGKRNLMSLYHRTDAACARQILKRGFRDGRGTYMTHTEYSGVWLSNVPLDENEGAHGDVLLRVEIRATEKELASFEWVEEGKGYREFLVLAAWLNPRAIVTVNERRA